MSPRAMFLGSKNRITVTVSTAIGAVFTIATLVGFGYKAKAEVEKEISDVNTKNAVQDSKIEQLSSDVNEIKADVKELLRRTGNRTP